MSERNFRTALLAALLCLASNLAQAADPATVNAEQLMTQEERAEQRNKMRAAKTEEERAAIRADNHQLMSERAAAQGKVLVPVNPQGPQQAGGRRGQGPGRGMGAGQGRQ
ncbi:hypothetical protein ACLIIZ_12775 [Azonexus caeni]|uniref:hypothetical protein n=1 Tax=Azonexus caeni TaxID=266126 RepID=UPI003A8622E8